MQACGACGVCATCDKTLPLLSAIRELTNQAPVVGLPSTYGTGGSRPLITARVSRGSLYDQTRGYGASEYDAIKHLLFLLISREAPRWMHRDMGLGSHGSDSFTDEELLATLPEVQATMAAKALGLPERSSPTYNWQG